MTTINPFLARFQNEPTLVAPENLAWFESCMAHAAAEYAVMREKLDAAHPQASVADDAAWWGEEGSLLALFRPYVVRDGILQIPVKGVLLHDFPYALFNWATGYDYIWRAFQRGMGDANVKGIALIVDSPGGMVAGCFECVDKMFALRGQKPVRGYAAESAYSAAYAIISVSDPGEITVTKTGGVGSIGVVTSHIDASGAMDQRGWVITFIHAGKHKVDGHPYAPLPDDVKARIQKRIDELYSIFVSTVARNRDLDEQAVRDTEALCYGASEALSIGLADKIGALDDSLADFSASLNLETGDENMADFTQADIDAARTAGMEAGRAEGIAQGKAEGLAEGATAERARINAILGSDEAKDRPKAALSTALKSNMDAEGAAAFLADLPKETPAAAGNGAEGAGAPAGMFQAAMGKTPNPDIDSAQGGDDGAGDEANETAGKINNIFALKGKK